MSARLYAARHLTPVTAAVKPHLTLIHSAALVADPRPATNPGNPDDAASQILRPVHGGSATSTATPKTRPALVGQPGRMTTKVRSPDGNQNCAA